MKFKILLFTLFISFSACDILNIPSSTNPKPTPAPKPNPSPIPKPTGTVLQGEASYYADKFHGRTTANGEKYDKTKLTAAHKTLAFGTKVEVTNTKNGKKVIVRINDRMPKTNFREIDLSRAAAQAIGMIQDGIVDVTVRILK